jgi:hypothetical protein
MKKVSAVEWLITRLPLGVKNSIISDIEQAKEMEKQQIIDARQDGFNRCFRKGDRKEVANEQYYNETFKNK